MIRCSKLPHKLPPNLIQMPISVNGTEVEMSKDRQWHHSECPKIVMASVQSCLSTAVFLIPVRQLQPRGQPRGIRMGLPLWTKLR